MRVVRSAWTITATAVMACTLAWMGCGRRGGQPSEAGAEFDFVVVSDVEAANSPKYASLKYFPGVSDAIRKEGKGAFLVAAGDISPPAIMDAMLRDACGEDYLWYPVVGNHDTRKKHLAWIREHVKNLPGPVRRGPKNAELTTYAFNHGDSHFIILNIYYSGLSDSEDWSDICPSLYDWLERDLRENKGKRIFVFGHEPLAAVPDADNGVVNHVRTNLGRHPKNANRFWQLLREHRVAAYVCGHTDTFSWAKLNGVWQVSDGHARGVMADGTQSTFLKFLVRKDGCRVQVYRGGYEGGPYRLARTVTLD